MKIASLLLALAAVFAGTDAMANTDEARALAARNHHYTMMADRMAAMGPVTDTDSARAHAGLAYRGEVARPDARDLVVTDTDSARRAAGAAARS